MISLKFGISSTCLFMNMCISLFGRLILCLRLERPEVSCTLILCEMSTPPLFPPRPSCEVSAVCSGGNRQCGSRGGRAITCCGLGSARLGVGPTAGAVAAGSTAPTPWGPVWREGGRTDAGTEARGRPGVGMPFSWARETLHQSAD